MEGSFARNFAITFSGSAFVTLIGFLLTPVISRIYTPEAYGLFAVFNTILNNINAFTTLSFLAAFVRPKEHDKFLSLVQLTFFLTVLSFFLVSAGLFAWGDLLLDWLQAEKLKSVLFLLPLVMLFANLNSIMINWYVRTKNFTKRTSIDVGINFSAKLSTIGYGAGISGTSPAGLIIGDLISKAIGTFFFLKSGIVRELGVLYCSFSLKRIKAIALEYKRYPLFILPANYISIFSVQLPVFMLSSFGASAVGFFAFSASMLEIPLNLLGNAVSPVFLQKAADTYHTQRERLGEITLAVYSKLLYLGLIPFGILTIYGDWIFSFVFGEKWEMSGVFSGYLGFYFIFRLIAYPLSSIFTIIGRESYEFYANILILVLRAAGLGIGIYLKDVSLAILLFSLGSLFFYFLISQFILFLLKVPVIKTSIKTMALVGGTFLILKLIRVGIEHYLF